MCYTEKNISQIWIVRNGHRQMAEQAGKIEIRGVLFDDVDMAGAMALCRGMLEENRAHVIHTPNAEIVQLCVEQPSYYALINSADLIIPDGAGVVLASRILHKPLRGGKVAGIELCENLIAYAAQTGRGVYFLGGKPGLAERAAENMRIKYPGLRVSGCHDGYFKEDAAVIEEINGSGAEILLVCLGVPRQESWMHAHREELNVRLMGGFGGSFDIFAGAAKRAPRIFIRLHLEWFYRLLRQPSRIGRMMKLPKFVLGTIFARR